MIDETIFSIENAVEEIATLRRGEILTINDRRLSAAMLRLGEVLEILRTVEESERVDNPPELASAARRRSSALSAKDVR